MKKTRLIPLYRTFTNWIITVAIGSALLPFVSFIVGGNGFFSGNKVISDETLPMILFSIVISAICSIPALLVLFFAHWILNNSTPVWKNHQLIQNGVHLFVALATFTVMGISFGNNDRNFLWVLVLAYTPTGIITWNLTYWLCKRKKEVEVINSEVLD